MSRLPHLLIVILLLIASSASAQFYQTQWGSYGSGNGQFEQPTGIAVDSTGNVYVADNGNLRIQKFTSSGTFVTAWGSYGDGGGQFISLSAIAVDAGGNVYVADGANKRIQKFSSSGSFITMWGSSGTGIGQFVSPSAIAVDVAGNVYVADNVNERIQKFTVTGSFVAMWGSSGTGNGQFVVPSAISVDINGDVYVTDTGNNRIQKFTGSGSFVTAWGSPGSRMGQFNGPDGIAVDPTGNVYVTDLNNNRIQEFTGSGVFITTWGSSGQGNGQLNSPSGLAVDAGSNVYVVDQGNERIQKFSVLNIVSLSSSGGLVGSSITITGTGFSSISTVQFNGIPSGSVTVNSPTRLVAIVPRGATTGNVTITQEGYTAESPNVFLVLPLTITSFTPNGVATGISVTITGTGFSSIDTNNVVAFNGIEAVVTYSSPTSIIATVPNGISNGKISVTVAGETVTSPTDYFVTKLAVANVNYPVFFTVGENNEAVSITVNDITQVQSVKFHSRGITADTSKTKVDDVPFSVTSNIINFSIPSSYFTDPLGLYSWFSLTDESNNQLTIVPQYIYLSYPSISTEQTIPDLTAGEAVSAYQLISVPLELQTTLTSSVFSDLGEYNEKKWRLFSFQNGVTAENPLQIQTGNGYWFIMRDSHQINPGAGHAVEVTASGPFQISLNQGWNLIGNPYNFAISWNDVMTYNNLPSQVLKFRQYLDGAFVDEAMLSRFRGGFVYSDSARVIGIPIVNESPSGSRLAENDSPSPIDAQAWGVNLTLDDGQFQNELYGFGMNPTAKEGKDVWDEVSLPLLDGLSSYTMILRVLPGMTLSRDVVPTQDNYSWLATLSSDHGVTIRWDNSYFGTSNKQLVLENPAQVELVDLRKATQAMIPAGNYNLKFHYGSPAYIQEEVLENRARVGNVYPNPIARSPATLFISVSLPAGTNEVALQLIDLLGNRTALSGKGIYDGGRDAVDWQEDFSSLAAGIYLLQIETIDEKGSTTITYRRVMLE